MNQAVLQQLNLEQVEVEICRVEQLQQTEKTESEVDEIWSYVGNKENQRWLWQAMDHSSGKVWAYVFGRRQDDALLELKQRKEPFGITRFYTHGWGADERHLDRQKHVVGKQHMQRIESKQINLRTRIKRLA